MGALLVIAVAAITVAAYLISLKVHPWAPCSRCSGGGKSRDRLWRGAFGTCPSCGGRGKHPRLGVKVLQPGRARRLAPPANHKRTDERR